MSSDGSDQHECPIHLSAIGSGSRTPPQRESSLATDFGLHWVHREGGAEEKDRRKGQEAVETAEGDDAWGRMQKLCRCKVAGNHFSKLIAVVQCAATSDRDASGREISDIATTSSRSHTVFPDA